MNRNKLNKSVNTLAEAFRDVISEAISPVLDIAVETNKKIDNMKKELKRDIATTNKNMQAQMAKMQTQIGQLRKDIQKDIRNLRI